MTWRAIKDNVDESESLAAVSDFAERVYWRLLAKSDSWGRLPGSPAKIRARCLPLLGGVTDEHIAGALGELHTVGRIDWYEIDGEFFVQLVDFDAHQPKSLIARRGEPSFPAPPDARPRTTTPAGSLLDRDREEDREKSSYKPPLETPGRAAEKNTSKNGKDAARPATEGRRNGHGSLTWDNVHEILADRDDRTASVIRAFSRGLPEAALHTAVESLTARREKPGRPLVSEARYFVQTLKRMAEEGQYR